MARKLVYRLFEQVDDKLFYLGGDFDTPEKAQAAIPEDWDYENGKEVIVDIIVLMVSTKA